MAIRLNQYKIERIQNKITNDQMPIEITNISRKDGKMVKRDDMIKICNKLKKGIKSIFSSGIVIVSIKYPNRYFSGNASSLNQDINYFTADDYDEFDEDPNEYKSFQFSFIPIAKKQGGNDEHNDCLVNCIKKVVQTHKDKINPEELKSVLGLSRDDKIPLDKLPQVEQYITRKTQMEYGFYVSGDYEYISSLNTNKIIRLILSNEHFTLDNENISHKTISFEEKPIVIFQFNNDVIECFDGIDYFELNRVQFDEIKNKPLSSKCLLVDKHFNAKTKKMTMADAYHYYIKMANEMKEATEGRINFFKCGSVKDMALHLFYQNVKSVQPDTIHNNEASWIDNASFGATTYWKQYAGNIHSFDVNSHYPNVMSKNFNLFPMREGEFKKIDKIEEKAEYGIYRCVISNPNNKVLKLFRFNPLNYYTHYDVELAKQYSLKIELIQDEQPNFLFYSKDKLVNGAFLFKHYINDIYALKEKKIGCSKDLLNVLYGGLCEKRHTKFSVDTETELNITNAKIVNLYTTEDKIKIKVISYKYGYYKTPFARILPFVLGLGRDKLFHTFKNFQDVIVRTHTDGIWTEAYPKDILIAVSYTHLTLPTILRV